ncbi:hypothetical protein THRCLA_09040 [Thraustotheca clavata]|uniref:UDENN domain-containing protein n=1 Tax=Thraustotheca clavata TaxID=74557 RepID=A0A1V9Z028_9STRA|nr:hypothetical protein THRCLA_09040 [Thraustotheca clavata]
MNRNQQRVADAAKHELCADCCGSLANGAWAAVSFGAFVCLQCAGAHRQLGVQLSRVKSVQMDAWNEEEMKAMLKGNRIVHGIYEKYLKKETKEMVLQALNDGTLLREEWIRLKYEKKLFMKEEGNQYQVAIKKEKRNANGSIVEVSKRLVNYFVVVGRGQFTIGKQNVEHASLGPDDVQFVPTILDSFPDPHSDAPLPSHISQFAFPEGFSLSSTHQSPTFFSFVLTNVSGAKLYACALKFYEELTPLEVISLFAVPQNDSKTTTIPTWAQELSSGTGNGTATSVFCPKCLIVISHHPFFSSFRHFLQQIYRISLSTAPMPLERYISNLVCEVPMPPQGKIQVQLTLPERTLYLARPPKNQMPLADFSFRYLFQVLDIANVMTVVSCLLLEQKVALCSKHLSLLTPIAETLIALLFPFAWQGAYIPVLPSSLLDVIDAPVPFLVGVHSKYLATASRCNDVYFIDLDHNRIISPRNENEQEVVLPKMPERESTKLRAKLLECANIFDPYSVEISKADLAYPCEEYLEPITDFASSGMTVPIPGSLPKNRKSSLGSAERKLNSLSQYGNLNFPSLKLLGHPSSASQMAENRSASEYEQSSNDSSFSVNAFSQEDIRLAFLRFFVSLLKKYATYLNCATSTQTPTQPIFDANSFLRDNSDMFSRPFLSIMIESQMFQRFCEDRLYNPTLNEVVFFDQAINQKLNRSLTIGKKKLDVSFLEDKSDVIRETFVAPTPSTLGLPDNGTLYHYKSFPRLKKCLFGTIRKPRELYATREQQRYVAPVDVHQQIYRLSTCVKDTAASWDATRRLITKLQSYYRAYRHRCEYQRIRKAILCIQHLVLARLKVAIKGFVYAKRYQRLYNGILLLQARYRGKRQQRLYARTRQDIIRLQSVFRGVLARIESHKWRLGLLGDLRNTIFGLWRKAYIPLMYRSKFWMIYDKPDYLSIGVHLDEITRLQAILGLKEENTRMQVYPAKVSSTQPRTPELHSTKAKIFITPVLDVHKRKARARRNNILNSTHSSFEIVREQFYLSCQQS